VAGRIGFAKVDMDTTESVGPKLWLAELALP
jgi:hypothetical protein